MMPLCMEAVVDIYESVDHWPVVFEVTSGNCWDDYEDALSSSSRQTYKDRLS